jgi:hypothetical protein
MDYTTANEKLQGRNKLSRKVANNTYLVRNSGVPGDSIHLKLHNTYIITWYADGRIELNTGGWFTVTTKARITEFLSGYSIGQERGVWYLSKHTSGPAYWTSLGVFADGLTIHADDSITGMSPLDDAKEKNKLRRRVAMFAKHYIQAFQSGQVPAPSTGDCFYCAMRTSEGKTLGETLPDKDHLLSHLEENYFVPSLLHQAFETMPHSQAMGWALAKHWGNQDIPVPEFIYNQLQKSLSRYMLRQLGQAA